MARYLQVEAGVVAADLRGAGRIEAPHMIPVADDAPATCGWQWDGEAFSEPPPVTPSPAEAARAALIASDVTILRCVERGIAVPEVWADYREALREIVREGAGELPNRPDWP